MGIATILERHALTKGLITHPVLSGIAACLLVMGLWLYAPRIGTPTLPAKHTKTFELWATPTTKVIPYQQFNERGPSVRVSLNEFKRIVGDRSFWILMSDKWFQGEVRRSGDRIVTYMFNLEANKWLYAEDSVPELHHTGWIAQTTYDERTRVFTSRIVKRNNAPELLGMVLSFISAVMFVIVTLGRNHYWGDDDW